MIGWKTQMPNKLPNVISAYAERTTWKHTKLKNRKNWWKTKASIAQSDQFNDFSVVYKKECKCSWALQLHFGWERIKLSVWQSSWPSLRIGTYLNPLFLRVKVHSDQIFGKKKKEENIYKGVFCLKSSKIWPYFYTSEFHTNKAKMWAYYYSLSVGKIWNSAVAFVVLCPCSKPNRQTCRIYSSNERRCA